MIRPTEAPQLYRGLHGQREAVTIRATFSRGDVGFAEFSEDA
jgi:hypothetical protein